MNSCRYSHIEIFREMHMYTGLYVHTFIYTYVSLLCQLGDPRSQETPEAMRIPNTQTLVPNTKRLSRKKISGLLREMADPTGAGNIQNEPGASCRARK